MWPVSNLVSPPSGRVPGEPFGAAPRPPLSAGGLIMTLFIASLTIGFASVFVGYAYLHALNGPQPLTPRMPALLWLSTTLMLASSGMLTLAVRAARNDNQIRLRQTLVSSFILSTAFLISQTINIFAVVAMRISTADSKAVAFFYFMILLHALHILGGMVALGFAISFAYRGQYTRHAHATLRYTAIYWYFLDAIWIAMFALFLSFGRTSL